VRAPLPVFNPQNRFVTTSVTYDDGELPEQQLHVYEDQTRNILATNDSPDVGFKWSVNPYRGCQHACSYCVGGDTEILMADGTTCPIRELRAGDEVYGTLKRGGVRRLVRTRVKAHWQTLKPAFRIVLADGRSLVASADHRFLTPHGWRRVEKMRGRATSLVGARMPARRVELRLASGAVTMAMLLGARDERRATTRVLDDSETVIDPAHDVVAVEDLRGHQAMFDITTGTGDFIANGVVSHNCYARPGHEYLSFSAGTDFEKKIVVKPRAAELLREAFEKKSWKGELIVFSGVTDCYQPLERTKGITRACLEVCAEFKNPVGIITKSPVVERDIDVLQELARVASVRVSISVPFWDPDAARAMEPWVTTPQRRMKIVETLAKAGIPVGVSISPIVPGLNDEHLGEVLKAASEAGAVHAFYVLLRLPGAVKEVFEERLRQNLPLRAEKILRRMREAHGGKLYDSSYGTRQTGHGQYAQMIAALFERTAKRYGLVHDEMRRYDIPTTFRRPDRTGQTSFGF
jgi:DNA repair photolyase